MKLLIKCYESVLLVGLCSLNYSGTIVTFYLVFGLLELWNQNIELAHQFVLRVDWSNKVNLARYICFFEA